MVWLAVSDYNWLFSVQVFQKLSHNLQQPHVQADTLVALQAAYNCKVMTSLS